jgi:biotin carboxyl carrier protein
LSNKYLRIGSNFEEKPWTLSSINPSAGLFALSGEAVVRALRDAAPELAQHSEAVRALHAQALQNASSLCLPFVATRVEATRIAITCLGQTLVVESSRHRAHASGQTVRTKTEISAPLAGKITAVCVEPHQPVQTGQVLFVMESMKMQFEIRADHDAVIDTVVGAPGQVLTGPSVLATLKIPAVS